MKTRIIVDSTADLMPEFKSRVQTVPLTVNFGGDEYIDGVYERCYDEGTSQSPKRKESKCKTSKTNQTADTCQFASTISK